MRLSLAFALAAPIVAGVAAPALAAVHGYGGLALSPAGDELASIESGATATHAAIVIRSAADGHIVRTLDPCPACSYAGIAYGPGNAIAFVARDRKAGTAMLEVAAGAQVRTVATVAGLASTPRFAPDGKRIALLVTLGANKETGATQAGVRQVGEIGEQNDEQRLAVFDLAAAPVAAAQVKPISPADRFIYEYDWMPDGQGFAVTSALGNGDNNWWIATLDRVDATTGAVTNIAKPATQLNFPRVSPDGKTVAYIGGLMSDNGSVGGDVYTVPIGGGTPSNVMPGSRLTVTSLARYGRFIQGTALKGDQAGLFTGAGDRADGMGWSRPASLAAGDAKAVYSADGARVAMVVQDYTHAPAIYAGPVNAPVQITHDNDALKPAVKARSVTWKNDGYTVQGWLLSPTVAPRGKAPMIVAVHGGPSAASGPRFIEKGLGSALPDAGYYLFFPNPRGSYGQGEAFTAANKRDFGGGDLRDILAGVDAVEKIAPVDDARLGLEGCSYGGFMAMWANTQTNRFKAIVAGAGLSNWVSYYGTNGIDQWMIPFTGKSVYDDFKVYEDMSAVYHVKTAKTPTFIYVGERDIEVPPTQSIEWWHALRNNGVDSSLVIYPDAGHCVPTQAADVSKRSLAWFGKYLAPGNAVAAR